MNTKQALSGTPFEGQHKCIELHLRYAGALDGKGNIIPDRVNSLASQGSKLCGVEVWPVMSVINAALELGEVDETEPIVALVELTVEEPEEDLPGPPPEKPKRKSKYGGK